MLQCTMDILELTKLCLWSKKPIFNGSGRCEEYLCTLFLSYSHKWHIRAFKWGTNFPSNSRGYDIITVLSWLNLGVYEGTFMTCVGKFSTIFESSSMDLFWPWKKKSKALLLMIVCPPLEVHFCFLNRSLAILIALRFQNILLYFYNTLNLEA